MLAHPAPEHNYTMLIVPRRPLERLAEADAKEVGSALATAIKRLVGHLGRDTSYNILARGLGAGHMHLEIVPRSTNVKGGAELAAGSATIDVDPRLARDTLGRPALRAGRRRSRPCVV